MIVIGIDYHLCTLGDLITTLGALFCVPLARLLALPGSQCSLLRGIDRALRCAKGDDITLEAPTVRGMFAYCIFAYGCTCERMVVLHHYQLWSLWLLVVSESWVVVVYISKTSLENN